MRTYTKSKRPDLTFFYACGCLNAFILCTVKNLSRDLWQSCVSYELRSFIWNERGPRWGFNSKSSLAGSFPCRPLGRHLAASQPSAIHHRLLSSPRPANTGPAPIASLVNSREDFQPSICCCCESCNYCRCLAGPVVLTAYRLPTVQRNPLRNMTKAEVN